MIKVLVVFGTRPEAIKCFPIVNALRRTEATQVRVCVTGQHRQILDQVLAIAELTPDIDLNLMVPNQSLAELTSNTITKLTDVIADEKPDWLIVQGDTTTAMCAALAAFYNRVPVGHVEAGLRSGNIYSPWPEEVNRKIISTIASLHFAPTERARQNLVAERVPEAKIALTGNTVIDALLYVRSLLENRASLSPQIDGLPVLDPDKRLILVTTHRRENFGPGMEQIANALLSLSSRGDVQIVLPVHPNPNVRHTMEKYLQDRQDIFLVSPLEYVPFVWLMDKSYIVLTDSGGVQEEAPSLGKPVLVMRDTTERPEGIESGNARLIGTETTAIVDAATLLLDDRETWLSMQHAANPYGDGTAAAKIVEAILNAG